MNKKQYYVQFEGASEGVIVDSDTFEAKREQLNNEHPDAQIIEMSPYDGNDEGMTQDNSGYIVQFKGASEAVNVPYDTFQAKKEQLYKEHPDAQVYSWRNRNRNDEALAATNSAISKLEEEYKAVTRQFSPEQAKWEYDADNIGFAQALNTAKQAKAQGADVRTQLDALYKERENNPSYQRAKKAQIASLEAARKNISSIMEANQDAEEKEHPDAARAYATGIAYGGMGMDDAMGMRNYVEQMGKGDNEYSYRQDLLRAANNFYEDALQVAKAPSRSDNSKTGLGNLFRGMVGDAKHAIPLMEMARQKINGNVINAIKKIQEKEDSGEHTNIVALVGQPDSMQYLLPEEREAVKALVIRSAIEAQRQGDLSLAYQAGQSAIRSLGFMADFMITGNLGARAASSVTGGAVKALAKASSKLGLKGIRRSAALAVPKLAVGSVQSAVKALVMAPMQPSYWANFADSMTRVNDAGEVVLSGKTIVSRLGDGLIEVFSESAGGQIEDILQAPLKGGTQLLKHTKFGQWAKILRNSPVQRLLRQGGFNNLGELGEEWYGNAVRVMTGVDKDALKDFYTVDQLIITAASFAPMMILGAVGSGAHYLAAKKRMTKTADALSGLLRAEGYDETTISNIIDLGNCENPTELAAALAPVVNQVAKDNGNASDIYKATVDYAKAVAQYRIYDGIHSADVSDRRDMMRQSINDKTGGANWYRTNTFVDDAGNEIPVETVRMLTDATGKKFYVTGEDKLSLAGVDELGQTFMFNKDALPKGMQDSGDIRMQDYIDMELAARKRGEDDTLDKDFRDKAVSAVLQQVQPGAVLNVGTIESPAQGTVRQVTADGAVIQYQDGRTRKLTLDRLGELLNIPMQRPTDEQMDESQANSILSAEDISSRLVDVKGSDITIRGQQYKLVGATTTEDGYGVSATVIDKDGKSSIITLTNDEAEEIASTRTAQKDGQPANDISQETEQGIPVDIKGKPMPMRTNAKGEQVVSERELWDRDPEAWAAYNDSNPDAVMSSEDFIAMKVKETKKSIEATRKEYQKEALSGMNEDKMDELRERIKTLRKRETLMTDILARNKQRKNGVQPEVQTSTQRVSETAQAIARQQAGFPGIQQRWNAAKKIEGDVDEIVLANGEAIKGRYILTEADAVTPSHNPADGYAMSEGFPVDENGKTVNDRDYAKDASAREIVESKARDYDQRALQDAVVVSNDGVVLSGNDRTMSGQMAAQKGTDAKYVTYLSEHAKKYGFTREQVASMSHPRVVFVPEETMPYNAATFAKFNQTAQKSQNKTETAVKIGKTISPATLARIADIISGVEDINELYANPALLSDLLDIMVSDGIITKEQVASMREGDKLSGSGMDIVEATLVGSVLDEEALRMALGDAMLRKSIVSALGQIITNKTLGEYSLSRELSDAVILVGRGRKGKVIKYGESVQAYVRQEHLFGDDVIAEATVQLLADAINNKRLSLLKSTLGSYNGRAADAAQGQQDVFLGTTETKEQILTTILKQLGYDIRTFDTSERAAKQGAAKQGTAKQEPQGGETGNAVRGGEGSRAEEVSQQIEEARQEQETAFSMYARLSDNQGNPVDADGKLILEPVASIDELTDADFTAPTRNVQLPELPDNVASAIGSTKPVIIKKNVFEKNARTHKDLTPKDGRNILLEALYNTNMYGQSQPISKPNYWVAIHTADKNRLVIIEVNRNKDNTEIVGWRYAGARQLKELENQAIGEGGQLLILTPENGAAAGLSTLPESEVSTDKGNNNSGISNLIEQSRSEVNTDPTEAQKKAGNYKMGHVTIDGYDISIENPKGSVRRGKNADGKEWQTTMRNDYGYLRGTEGVDGDHIDVFLSDTPEQGNVFVVDQVNPKTGEFDEHKVMYGFNSLEEARAAYLSNYEEGWQGLGNITEVSRDEFKKWVESSHRKTKPFAEYKSVKPVQAETASTEVKESLTTAQELATPEVIEATVPATLEEAKAALHNATRTSDDKPMFPEVVHVSAAVREMDVNGRELMQAETTKKTRDGIIGPLKNYIDKLAEQFSARLAAYDSPEAVIKAANEKMDALYKKAESEEMIPGDFEAASKEILEDVVLLLRKMRYDKPSDMKGRYDLDTMDKSGYKEDVAELLKGASKDVLFQLYNKQGDIPWAAFDVVRTTTAAVRNLNAAQAARQMYFEAHPEMPSATPTGKFDIWKFILKDKMKPALGGVFHDKGFKVASDTHILVALKEAYPKENEGKILDKKKAEIKGNFPKWRDLIKEGTASDIDVAHLASFVEGVKQQVGKEFKDVWIAIPVDGQIRRFSAPLLENFLRAVQKIDGKLSYRFLGQSGKSMILQAEGKDGYALIISAWNDNWTSPMFHFYATPEETAAMAKKKEQNRVVAKVQSFVTGRSVEEIEAEQKSKQKPWTPQEKWDAAEKALADAKSEEERSAAIRLRKEALADKMQAVADSEHPVTVTSFDDVVEDLRGQNVTEDFMAEVMRELRPENPNRGETRGFYIPDYGIYLVANNIKSIDDGVSTYVHERQHTITEDQNLAEKLMSLPGFDREKIWNVMRTWKASRYYQNQDTLIIADEFISMVMQRAYQCETSDVFEQLLRESGVDNEEIINFVKNIDNEQRGSESLSTARTVTLFQDSEQGSGSENDRDKGPVSGGDLGQEGVRPAESSASSTPRNSSAGEIKSGPSRQIEDFGEKIAGARKDELRNLSKTLEDATEEAFVALPLAKAFKRPNTKKLIENGVISQEDAALVDAVSWLILGSPKPVKLKDRSYKARRRDEEIITWAKDQARRAKVVLDYINADAEGKQAIIESLAEVPHDVKVAEDANRNHIIELNRGWKELTAGELYPINPIYAAYRIFQNTGYDPDVNGRIKFPIIKCDNMGRSYTVKSGNYGYEQATSVEDAIAKASYLIQLQMGAEDLDHPASVFKVRGIREKKVGSGRFIVSYFDAKRGRLSLQQKEFDNKEAALEFSREKNKGRSESEILSAVYEPEVWAPPTKYKIVAQNAATGEDYDMSGEYGSVEEAREAIDSKHEELNAQMNEAIQKANEARGESGKKRDKLYIAFYHENGKSSYGVWADDKGFWQGTSLLRGGFATSKEARAYMEEHRAEFESMLKDMAKKRSEFVFFDGNAESRKGKDYRQGKNVGAEEYKVFGFRGVQFGNWANDADRQAALNNAYDSFMNLAELLNVSPAALSLNGELGLAFGARGSGSALAHYEPDEIVINLTKTRGAGSLAHEWWHALDNYFARRGGVVHGFITAGNIPGVRPELQQAFDEMSRVIRASDYGKRSKQKGTYWGSDWEMTARLFAEWIDRRISEKGESDHFLVRGVTDVDLERWQDLSYAFYKMRMSGREEEPMSFDEFKKTPESLVGYPYPTTEEIKTTLGPLMQKVVDTISEKSEDGKTVLFSKVAEPITTYHGSGANFNAFDLQFLGSGEGTDVYGPGIYVSEVDGIAKSYADVAAGNRLAENRDGIDRQEARLQEIRAGYPAKITHHEEMAERMQGTRAGEIHKKFADNYRYMLETGDYKYDPEAQEVRNNIAARQQELSTEGKRHLYTVEIPGDNGHNYIVFGEEVPVEDAMRIRAALRARLLADPESGYNEKNLRELDDELNMSFRNIFGDQLLGTIDAYLGNDGVGFKSTQFLHDLGYVGIKVDTNYQDPNGDHTANNYVVFDSKDAHIVEHVRYSKLSDWPAEDKEQSHVRFSKVTDEKTLAELEKGETEIGYRNVVLNEDGTLGSPMADKLGKKGQKSVSTVPFSFDEWEQADEHPEMATDDGKINLIKPDKLGNVDAVDYNPYIHIRPTLLNKQFTGAWKRPNLVYVATAYPVSELTSGYRAEKAAKSVGRHEWNGGDLILSRYDKPVRIVPWDEVADEWAKEFKDRGVTFDIVPPGLLPVLVERGVEILPPKTAAGAPARAAYERFISRDYGVRFSEVATGRTIKPIEDLDVLAKRANSILRLKPIDVEETSKSDKELRADYMSNEPLEKDGLTIHFYGGGFDKSSRQPLFKHVVEKIRQILNESVLAYTEYQDEDLIGKQRPNNSTHKERRNVKEYRNYVGKVSLDGTNYLVRFMVFAGTGDATSTHYHRVSNVEFYKENQPEVRRPVLTGRLGSLRVDDDTNLEQFFELTKGLRKKISWSKLERPVEEIVNKGMSYPTSMGGKRRAADETASSCGVDVEFVTREGMPQGYENAAGVWMSGRILVCLENNADMAEVTKTILHEAVGHEGLRRLVGKDNMNAFLDEVFRMLPERRREIVELAASKHGWNLHEATEEYLAAQAEKLNPGEEYSRSFWDKMRDVLRRLLKKIGIDVNLNDRDIAWILWQSHNANREQDFATQVRRINMQHRLGFSMSDAKTNQEGADLVRARDVENTFEESAGRMYNTVVSLWSSRLRETWVDMYESVDQLVGAIEKATGMAASGFEDIRLALNQMSSKGLAAIKKWTNENWEPLKKTIADIVREKGISIDDIERYTMLKHGLERNDVFARRDARRYYDAAYRDQRKKITDSETLSEDEKKAMIDALDREYRGHLDDIANGTDAVYRKNRERDYGGLTGLFSTYDAYAPFNPSVESNEEYQARVLKARHPVYDNIVDTETAAAREVSEFEKMVGEKAISELWKRINAATKSTLKHQYDNNMLSKSQYEHVRDMFKYYIPLRGFEDTEAHDLYSYYNDSQEGNFERPLMQSKGRKTQAESPFGYIGAQASSAIAQDVKNDAKLALYFFLANRPQNGLAFASDVWYEVKERQDGTKELTPVYPPFRDDMSSAESKSRYEEWEAEMKRKAARGEAVKGTRQAGLDYVINITDSEKQAHVIKVKLNGEDKMILINGNPRAAQAINNELNVEMSKAYQVFFGKMLRFLSAINTNLAPEFWVSNLKRDVLFSTLNQFAKGKGREFVKNLPRAFSVVRLKYKYDNGSLDDNSYLGKMYKEFVENGGVTGFTTVVGNETWENRMRGATVRQRKLIEGFRNALETISDFGESIEQAPRFAAFLTAREGGADIRSAINDAKEVSVNFNRKGSGKAISWEESGKLRKKNGEKLNDAERALICAVSSVSVYGRYSIMFFNASVQGLNAVYKMYKASPQYTKAAMVMFFVEGAMNALVHALMGDDDDNDYLDLSEYERRNNLLLGRNGFYLKWELPQEFRPFYSLGDIAMTHALKRYPNKAWYAEFAQSLLDVAPFNPAEGLQGIAPSVAVPFIEVVMNKDFMGYPIYKDMRYLSDEEKKRTPKYQMAFRGTNEKLVDIAEALNAISGGDEYTAGDIDINPAVIEHYFETATGGIGRTLNKFFKTSMTLLGISDDAMDIRNVPFASRLFTSTDERKRNSYVNEMYDFYMAEAEHTKIVLNKYKKDRNTDKITDIMKSKEFAIMNITSKYDKLDKMYNKLLADTQDAQERERLMERQEELRKKMVNEIRAME